jgi:uncharacterized protein YqjF (DUF2071 family)
MTKTFLTAEWRKLIMAQYEVDPAILAPWLPPGVELDFYEVGDTRHCYISLIGFLFDQVRVKGISIPFHTSFEEVNLRFYVARTEPDGTRKRGVVFIREFVPREAIALVAELIYEEPYRAVAMDHSIHDTPHALFVSYRWGNRKSWQRMTVEAQPELKPIAPGSQEEFVTEHYWGYTKQKNGPTSEYQVQHPRWMVYPVNNFEIEVDFEALYGSAFAALTHQRPASVLLAEGSAVSVSDGVRLTG